MPNFRERMGALIAGKGLGHVYPTTEPIDVEYKMGPGGISAGKELGSGNGNSMVIFAPGGNRRKMSADRAMAQNNGWVYTATKAIADEVANTEWRFFQIKTNGDHEEQFDNPLLDLLNGVNEFQTGVEFKHLLASFLELCGNAYILLIGKDGNPVKSYEEIPASIMLLNPGRVTLLVDKSKYPYVVGGYKFTVDGNEHKYEAYQIVHLKYPDPNDQLQGIGTVQGISDWLDTDNFILASNRAMFSNSARPGGTLTSPYKGEAQISRLRQSFKQNYEGDNNVGKTVVLPDGVKFASEATTARDMDYANLMDRMEDRILSGFRVSRTVLGTSESDTNRATAETADYVFAKRTIKPKMMLITSYLNEFLVPRFGEDIYLSFDDPVPDDKSFRFTELQASVANAPVMSVNEAREEYLGLGPVEGGDEVMMLTSMAPLGDPSLAAAVAAAGDPAPTKILDPEAADTKAMSPQRTRRPAVKALYYVHGGKVKTRFAKNMEVRKELSADFKANFAKALKEANEERAALMEKGITELSKDEFLPFWKDFVGRVSKYEAEVKETMIKLNVKQFETVMENLPEAAGMSKAIDVKKLFDIDSWISLTVDALTPIFVALSKEESKAAAALIGKPDAADVFDTPEHRAALDKAIGLMSSSYNQTTLNSLKTQLDTGIQAGEDLFQLEDRVKGVYEFADDRRAGLIARTESFRIANDTTKETWKDSGVVTEIKWYTAEDAQVCEFCDEQDGRVIDIEDNFFTKGDTAEGSDGGTLDVDYTDVGAPPLHADCRCYVRPETVSL